MNLPYILIFPMLACMIQPLFPQEKQPSMREIKIHCLFNWKKKHHFTPLRIEREKAADTIKMFRLIKTPDECGSAFVRKHDTKNHSMYRCNKLCTQWIPKTKLLNLRAPPRDLLA